VLQTLPNKVKEVNFQSIPRKGSKLLQHMPNLENLDLYDEKYGAQVLVWRVEVFPNLQRLSITLTFEPPILPILSQDA
jgi:hypothetical protein